LNGFANLTRDFTDNIFGVSDKKYVASVYCEIYRQLLGINPSVENATPEDVIGEKKQNIEKESPMKPNADNHEETHEYSLHTWQQEIIDCAKNKAVKREKNRLIHSLQQALVENGHSTDYFKFITMLDKYDGWEPNKSGPNAAWKRMQEYFVPDYESRIKKHPSNTTHARLRNSNSQPMLDFSQDDNYVTSNSHNCFFEDDNAWGYIEQYIPEKDREKLHKDLIWFQSEIRKAKNDRYKYYQPLDERNNEVIIDKFCHLKEKPDKNGRDRAPYFTAELRDRIRTILNRVYSGK
jgi:hypothetical protein